MKNIMESAQSMGNCKIFLQAAKNAGLEDELKQKGSWTVFLPTDSAFLSLPAKALKSLLKDSKELAALLSYHLVKGVMPIAEVFKRQKLDTELGVPLKVNVTDEIELDVDDAEVTQTNIACSNGMIHLIDSVLIPKLQQSARQFRPA